MVSGAGSGPIGNFFTVFSKSQSDQNSCQAFRHPSVIDNFADMRHWIRRSLALAIALAFIGGGFGRVALSAAPDEPCHPNVLQAVSHGHEHGEHAEHAMHHEHHHDGALPSSGDGASEKSSGDQACFKCCGLCTIVSTFVPARPPGEVVFAGKPIVYVINIETYRGRPVVLDPGIPKRTA
ncbi:MAG: hypothetical protein ACJ8DQ_05875 [Xanthobacteraceae bacterium]|jgi:hypothetical protein